MRVKAPGKSKSHYEVYRDDVDQQHDDIEEDIQSSEDHMHTANKADSESGRGFGVTVSQSLGIDRSVDSLAIDEYDHIEEVEF